MPACRVWLSLHPLFNTHPLLGTYLLTTYTHALINQSLQHPVHTSCVQRKCIVLVSTGFFITLTHIIKHNSYYSAYDSFFHKHCQKIWHPRELIRHVYVSTTADSAIFNHLPPIDLYYLCSTVASDFRYNKSLDTMQLWARNNDWSVANAPQYCISKHEPSSMLVSSAISW